MPEDPYDGWKVGDRVDVDSEPTTGVIDELRMYGELPYAHVQYDNGDEDWVGTDHLTPGLDKGGASDG